MAGLGWGTIELSLYNSNFWVGKNFKYYKTSWVAGNQWTGTSLEAMKLARPAKLLGRFAFGVNLLYGGYTFTSELGNGNYSNATFTGLGMLYSSVATFGGVPGMLIAGPMVLIDSTIGLDNLHQHGVSMQIERTERINQGDFSSIWYTPGRLMR